MKYLVVLLLLGIVASLGMALFFMMKGERGDRAKGSGMARALTVRIALSVLLFLCLLLAWKLGYIHPSGLPVGR